MNEYFLSGEEQDYYVNQIINEMKKMVPLVYRDLSGSEDGEAVSGCDCMGEMRFHITFDPIERTEMDKHIKNGTLMEYIYQQSGMPRLRG